MPRSSRADFPPPVLIDTTDALDALCRRLRSEEFVTVDTEFMRERTYWPELCVVQLAGDARGRGDRRARRRASISPRSARCSPTRR